MIQDRAIATMEDWQEVVYQSIDLSIDLSTGTIFNDLG